MAKNIARLPADTAAKSASVSGAAGRRERRRERTAAPDKMQSVTWLSVPGGLLIGELLGRFVAKNPLFLASPLQAVAAMAELWHSGELQHHIWVSGAMSRLSGKAALVTGAGGAIGGAIARRFAAEGAAVACLDLDGDAAGRTAAAIAASGGRAFAVTCDVALADQVREAVERTVAQLGSLQVVVNTAANTDPGLTIVDIHEADWKASLDVNLTGVFLVCKYAIPELTAAHGGSIVIVASQLGRVVVPKRPAYVTTKAALIQLARALAVDHAGDGIRVNTLSPGAIETDRLTVRFGTMEKAREALAPLHPIGRLGRPEEIAAGALFLASDDSSFMTGADLVIDGGYTCV